MSVDGAIPPMAELQRDFGLNSESFRRCPDGFESECWIVDDRWFVKVWRADDHPVDLGLLDRLADAGLPVPRPLRSGLLRTDHGHRYAVFPYIHGRHATGRGHAATRPRHSRRRPRASDDATDRRTAHTTTATA